jgi:mRNA interferase RelE/StbE
VSYQVDITTAAGRQIRKLPRTAQKAIVAALTALATDPRPNGCKKLKGRDAWRVRTGDYRVIYEIDDGVLTVTVIKVGHRRDIYE